MAANSSLSFELVAATPPSDVVEEVVEEIVRFARSANLAMTLQVGELVFKKVFRGDFASVRDRGQKEASFARLAKHPKLPFSGTTLWRSVAIYELTCRLPGVANSKHLGVGHLAAVLGLSGETQEKLLRAAEKEKWSRDLIEQRARAHRMAGASKRGRRPAPEVVRFVKAFDKLVRGGALVVPAMGATLDVGMAMRAKQVVGELRTWCDAVDSLLGVQARGGNTA